MPGSRPHPDPVGPGVESVWDYPRPPRVKPVGARVRVVLSGLVIADTTRALRVLETSHPPNYYLPPDDIVEGVLAASAQRSHCEWKGMARYYDVRAGDRVEADAAWSYDVPAPGFESIARHVAFYASRLDACFVGDELVRPQPGRFYGGWITDSVAGPFKGVLGSTNW